MQTPIMHAVLVAATGGDATLPEPSPSRARALYYAIQVVLAVNPLYAGPWHANARSLTIRFPRSGGCLQIAIAV